MAMKKKNKTIKLDDTKMDMTRIVKKHMEACDTGEPVSNHTPYFDKTGHLRCPKCTFKVFIRFKKIKSAKVRALKCSKCTKWYSLETAPHPRQKSILSWLKRGAKKRYCRKRTVTQQPEPHNN